MPAEEAIRPIFTSKCPNDPIIFTEENNSELKAPILIHGKGCVEFRWQPSSGARFRFDPIAGTNMAPFIGLVGKHAILNIATDLCPSMDVIVTDSQLSFSVEHPALCKFEGLVANSRQDSRMICDQIKFHITNIDPYIGEIAKYPSGSSHRHRVILEDNNWEIIIDAVEEADELIKGLRKNGGFAITHVGILQQKGKKVFSINEAKAQLGALGYFLSFAEGRWCNPILLEGSFNGNLTYMDISGKVHLDPWKGNWRWCPRSADCLKEAYQGFMMNWQNVGWRRMIKKIMNLYIRANIYPTVELSVVDSFTALDYLANLHRIRNSSGSERISEVLKKEKLDKQSPPRELFAFYDEYYKTKSKHPYKQANGAEILNDFRNGVVHGNRNEERPPLEEDDDPNLVTVPFECKLEAENLGLWYVEMAILHEIGYDGRYDSRLTREYSRYPPWATSTSLKVSSDPDITASLPGIIT